MDAQSELGDHAASSALLRARQEDAAETARCASVKALQAECEGHEKKIRQSQEFKQFPHVGQVALRFGWTHEEFIQALTRRGQTALVTVGG